MSDTTEGYRVLPHVADLILEAWAPGRDACLGAAVRGLVATFADVGDAKADRRVELTVDASTDEALLVAVLEEVIFLLDTEGRVPVDVTLTSIAGGVRGWFDTVPVDAVVETGALPKGVSRSDVVCAPAADGRWRARVVVDV